MSATPPNTTSNNSQKSGGSASTTATNEQITSAPSSASSSFVQDYEYNRKMSGISRKDSSSSSSDGSSSSSSSGSGNSGKKRSRRKSSSAMKPPTDDSPENTIKLLSVYLNKFGDNFCTGKRVLSLNTLSMRYINARMREWARRKQQQSKTSLSWLLTWFDNSYLTSADFETLNNYFGILPRLMVQGNRDETELDLTFFTSLTELEVRQSKVIFVKGGENIKKISCVDTLIDVDRFPALTDIKVNNCPKIQWTSLKKIVPFVQHIYCYNHSVNSLASLLRTDDALKWDALVRLDCTKNQIYELDDSLQYAPSIQQLNLSNNSLTRIAHLHYCIHLTLLDLSHNAIEVLDGLTSTALPNVRILNLSHNNIISTKGMDQLASLEVLDLSYNLLKDWKDVKRLRELAMLESLTLLGNRNLTCYSQYREYSCGFFSNKLKFSLDGKQATKAELYSHQHIKSLTPTVEQPKLDWKEAIVVADESVVIKTKKRKKRSRSLQHRRTVEEIPEFKKQQEPTESKNQNNSSESTRSSSSFSDGSAPTISDEASDDDQEIFQRLSENYSDEDVKTPPKQKEKISKTSASRVKKHLEALKRDGGDQWLIILSEYMLSQTKQDEQKEQKVPSPQSSPRVTEEEEVFQKKAQERYKRRLQHRQEQQLAIKGDNDDIVVLRKVGTGKIADIERSNEVIEHILRTNKTTARVSKGPLTKTNSKNQILKGASGSSPPSGEASSDPSKPKKRRNFEIADILNQQQLLEQLASGIANKIGRASPRTGSPKVLTPRGENEKTAEGSTPTKVTGSPAAESKMSSTPSPKTDKTDNKESKESSATQSPANSEPNSVPNSEPASARSSLRVDDEFINLVQKEISPSFESSSLPTDLQPITTTGTITAQISQKDNEIEKILADSEDVIVNLGETDNLSDSSTKEINTEIDLEDILNKDDNDISLEDTLYVDTDIDFIPQHFEVNPKFFKKRSQLLEDEKIPGMEYVAFLKKVFLTNVTSLEIVETASLKKAETVFSLLKIEEVKVDSLENEKFVYIFECLDPLQQPHQYVLRYVFNFMLKRYSSPKEADEAYAQLFPKSVMKEDKFTVEHPEKFIRVFVQPYMSTVSTIVIGMKDQPTRETTIAKLTAYLESWQEKWPQINLNKKGFFKDIQNQKVDTNKRPVPPAFTNTSLQASIESTMEQILYVPMHFHKQTMRPARTPEISQSPATSISPQTTPSSAPSTKVEPSATTTSTESTTTEPAQKRARGKVTIQPIPRYSEEQEHDLAAEAASPVPKDRKYKYVGPMKQIPYFHEIMKVHTPKKYLDSMRKGIQLVVTEDHWPLHCTLNIFKESEEEYRKTIYTNAILSFSAKGNDLRKRERSIALVFSNLKLYFLSDNNTKVQGTASQPSLTTMTSTLLPQLAHHAYSKLTTIHASYNFQQLKLSFQSEQEIINYMFLPRDEFAGKRIVQYLIECGAYFELIVHQEDFMNAWNKSAPSFNLGVKEEADEILEIETKPNQSEKANEILGCFSVYTTSSSKDNVNTNSNVYLASDIYPARVGGDLQQLVARSLIITSTNVLLVDETYEEFPTSLSSGNYLSLVAKESVTDLAHLERHPAETHSGYLTIAFDKEGSHNYWNIVAAHESVVNAIIKKLNEVYSNAFKVDLEVRKKEVSTTKEQPTNRMSASFSIFGRARSNKTVFDPNKTAASFRN